MTRYIAKVYRVNLADNLTAAQIAASTLAAATPANLVLTTQGDSKEDIATHIMHSGAVDFSPEKNSQGHRI